MKTGIHYVIRYMIITICIRKKDDKEEKKEYDIIIFFCVRIYYIYVR